MFWVDLILRLARPRVVALVGGGGKTSLMAWMHSACLMKGMRVVSTATTKLSAENTCGYSYVTTPTLAEAEQYVAQLPRYGRQTAMVLGPSPKQAGKMQGVPPEWIDALAEKFPDTVFLVEADGAAGLPLKGHLSYEPVIPQSTRLVIPVFGAEALMMERPADELIHRLARFYELTGLVAGAPISLRSLCDVLFHPEGYLRGIPADATVVPFINKVETMSAELAAARLSRLILERRNPQVVGMVVGSVAQERFAVETAGYSKVAGIILAAGASTRMGKPKQLLRLDDEPLVKLAAKEAVRSRLGEVIVVTGSMHDDIEQALERMPVQVLFNSFWQQGQSTSVATGVKSVDQTMQAMLFLLCDQPLIHAGLIDQIIAVYEETGAAIVAPRFKSRIGNPVLFARETWQGRLMSLTGDEGARRILKENPDSIAYVEVENEDVFRDIDTPEDFDAVRSLWHRRSSKKGKEISVFS